LVSIGNTAGRAFTGIHGNGSLSVNGNADVPNWPGIVSSEVTTATGSGLRGGAWNTIILTLLRVSDRFNTNVADATRNNAYGFRAVRALPSSAVE
jgi:formylglycine-generating enzyme required for sulfatase activity